MRGNKCLELGMWLVQNQEDGFWKEKLFKEIRWNGETKEKKKQAVRKSSEKEYQVKKPKRTRQAAPRTIPT